jgi:hypothetical protein
MCPLCKEHDGRTCTVTEKPDGRVVCACGRHSWPGAAAFLESCRKLSLTITGHPQIWTQSF